MIAQREQSYLPQVDGLRTLAVGGVLLSHYGAGGNWGHLGVRLFFVISGYLITGILLGLREEVAIGRRTFWSALCVFYIRRFLRIFPLYYAVLCVSLLRPLPLRLAPWYFLYGSNILFARNGSWGPLAHFWSLAVEEQFYVAWPLLTLLIPRRALGYCLGVMVAGASAWRFVAVLSGLNAMYPDILLPACLDSLALGALLAHMEEATSKPQVVRRTLWIALAAGATLIGAASLLPHCAACRIAIFDLGYSLAFVWLIFRARLGSLDLAGRLLQSVAIVYVGRISYGVYVFHGFGWNLASHLASGLKGVALIGVRALLAVIITIALASLSWRFYEGPLNGLKRHFAYRTRSEGSVTREALIGTGG